MSKCRASIIVLCYNSLEEATKSCLESVIQNTPPGSYELIIIDNASNDGTAEYLKDFSKKYSHVRIQLNNQNKGYAAGNNDGIRLAQGEYLVLLNNDTLVPEGWLNKLTEFLDKHPKVGLVGPITNSAGNEQRVEIVGLSEKNYEKKSSEFIERHKDSWFSTEKLGFFCVAMRQASIEQFGYLDEQFGIGMFEDDDYCLRVKKAGYTLAVLEDCFVYHKGSISFKKFEAGEYQDIFNRNREYFRNKHGIEWTFSDIAFSYWIKFKNDLDGYEKNNPKASPEIERIQSRIENFKHLLMQIHRAELAQIPSDIRGASMHPVSLNAKRQARIENFKQSIVFGTNLDRLRYAKHVSRKLWQRFNRNGTPILPPPILEELKEIRDSLRGRKIIFFPATVDFNYMMQRPQQLAKAFSESGFVVIYGTLNYQSDKVKVIEKIAQNLYLMNEGYFSFLASVFTPQESIYYCMWPNNIKHLKNLPYAYLIYDYMDELELLDLPRGESERDHKRMIEAANLITVSSDKLLEKIPKQFSFKTLLINNAVSQEFIDLLGCFNEPLCDLITLPERPVLGYYGAISDWFDFDLIKLLAGKFPHAKIILIGPVSESVSKKMADILWSNENVILLPACKHLDLVRYLRVFDVCLIPFIKGEISSAISPVKLYEYLSASKNVVSTDLDECKKFSCISVSSTHDEFIEIIEKMLKEMPLPPNADGKKIALENTWLDRVQEIRRYMQNLNNTKQKN